VLGTVVGTADGLNVVGVAVVGASVVVKGAALGTALGAGDVGSTVGSDDGDIDGVAVDGTAVGSCVGNGKQAPLAKHSVRSWNQRDGKSTP
jgi:hypothetical protein